MHFQRHFEPLGQGLDGAPRFRRPDQVDGVRRRAADGGGPGGAAVAVGQHLDFVDHGHFHRLLGIEHLDRAGNVGAALGDAAFLAGDQTHLQFLAVRTGRLQALVVFQRQQAQRREIDAAGGFRQRFHRAVGLAGVGWPEQGDELARHAAGDLEGFRVLGQVDAFLGTSGVAFFLLALDGVLHALADALEHVFGRLRGFQLLEHAQEDARVEAGVVGLLGDLGDKFLGVHLEFGQGLVAGAFLDQVAPRQRVHLAPLARLGQHAARRHQGVAHAQAVVFHFAGKTQEDAAFHLDQLDAALGQFQVLYKEGVVAAVGIVIGMVVAKITHV